MIDDKDKQIINAVEESIKELLIDFKNSPHIFWTEEDVRSYLYHLLISNDFFKKNTPLYKREVFREKLSSGKTLLVHTETKYEGKKEDITIFELKEELDEIKNVDFYVLIGIEIKFNRKNPSSGKSNILDDIKSLKDHEQGYIVWLNWDRPIDTDILKDVKKTVEKSKNIKLFYYDAYSERLS